MQAHGSRSATRVFFGVFEIRRATHCCKLNCTAMLRSLLLSASLACAAAQYDAVVYGATAGGVIAAINAANEGANTLLLHPLAHVGGMVSGGLGETDKGNPAVIGGMALDFFKLVCTGGASPAASPCFTFVPHVAEQTFLAMIANTTGRAGKLTLVTSQTLTSVTMAGSVIRSISVAPSALVEGRQPLPPTANGVMPTTTYTAAVFLDGTYEGDLFAMAGASFAVGRESAAQYNESLAGRVFVPNKIGGHQFPVPLDPLNHTTGEVLPMIYTGDPGEPGEGDAKVQAYNFRMCLSSDPANQVPWAQPANYDPAYWELFRRYLATAGQNFGLGNLMNIGLMPDNKTDVNNNGPISTDFIGGSWDWPTATPAQRVAIWQAHKDYTAGFFWFLLTDPASPPHVRQQMAGWGLAKDEFTDNGNWPWQLYVREGRRLVGDWVMTQDDRQFNLHKNDSIGLLSYNTDTHNAQRFVQGTYVRNEGDVEQLGSIGSAQMAYRLLLPKRAEVTNLLVPISVSASHIAYGAVRLEPQYMILGQAAGVAAAMAVKSGSAVQDVDVPTLQARLRQLGALIDM